MPSIEERTPQDAGRYYRSAFAWVYMNVDQGAAANDLKNAGHQRKDHNSLVREYPTDGNTPLIGRDDVLLD